MFNLLLILSFIPIIICSDLWFGDCGPSDEYMKITGVVMNPYPIKYPGNISYSPTLEIYKDIPSEDLKMSVSVDKLTPKRMHIPCINNFGSCTADYCEEYKKHTNILLTQFGLGLCPLKTGKYTNVQPSGPLPSFGSIFEKIMEGDFESNATFYNGKTNVKYGCVTIRFSVELNK